MAAQVSLRKDYKDRLPSHNFPECHKSFYPESEKYASGLTFLRNTLYNACIFSSLV